MFRRPALEARRTAWIGDVVLVRPPSFSAYCLVTVLFTGAVGVTVSLGSYSQRAELHGHVLRGLPDVVDGTGRLVQFVAPASVARAFKPGDRLDVNVPSYPPRLIGATAGVVREVNPMDGPRDKGATFIVLVYVAGGAANDKQVPLVDGTLVTSRVLLGRVPLFRKFGSS